MERSPTALAIAKRSFNADTEHLRGVALAGFQTVGLYYNTDEGEGDGRCVQSDASRSYEAIKCYPGSREAGPLAPRASSSFATESSAI